MEYISKDSAIASVMKHWANEDVIILSIVSAPEADVAPVRRGEWVEIGHETECPFCGEPTGLMTPYCPQCGAKLDTPKR